MFLLLNFIAVIQGKNMGKMYFKILIFNLFALSICLLQSVIQGLANQQLKSV